MNDSQLSPSLLHCLDGHEPDEVTIDSDKSTKTKNEVHVQQTSTVNSTKVNAAASESKCFTPHNSYYRSRLSAMNNARKRAANSEYEKITQTPLIAAAAAPNGSDLAPVGNKSALATANKENINDVDGYLRSKKLLISEYPGETSF